MKKAILKAMMPLGLYPHVRFTYSPFKIIEFAAMMDRIEMKGNERVLDIGCGDGLHTMLIGKQVGHITGIDTNENFIRDARVYAEKYRAQAKCDYESRPLEEIGYPDNHFDIIFSICVIEHIPNYEEVLQECLRILKPGGRIIFTVDTLETIEDEALIASHKQQHHVMQYFRKESMDELLTGIGFEVTGYEQLFRSNLARKLFVQGIRKGFNFGRFRCTTLARQLATAESAVPVDAPGIFLLADARRPLES
jgi:ubiquinone/menaquinone biosynthesis C-methylase UbiE